MSRKIICSVCLWLITLALPAQTARNKKVDFKKHNKEVMQAFADSIQKLSESFDSRSQQWENLDSVAPVDVLPNHYYYKLFVPPTYYFAPVRQAFGINWRPGKWHHRSELVDSVYSSVPDTIKVYSRESLEKCAEADRFVNRILMKYYMKHPDRVKGNEIYLQDVKVLADSLLPNEPRQEDMKSFLDGEKQVENVNSDSELVVIKPNFWTYSGNGKIQFTQNSLSDNWYKGGESTNALLSELTLSAKYNDKHRIEFENVLEFKLGFISAPSDTVHEYKTNSDLIRFNSKLGIKAVKDWYYTLSTEAKTQFFPSYKTNSNDLISNFLAPLQLKVSLGMDYKKKKNNFEISLLGAPFSYRYIYLKDHEKIVNPSSFEVENGRSSANLFGSEFKVDMTWNMAKNIKWVSKFEYFTTYKKVTVSWENTFNFQLNRYLSTSLFIHPRFDDGVVLSEDNDTYFQFKEIFTFGLSYSW